MLNIDNHKLAIQTFIILLIATKMGYSNINELTKSKLDSINDNILTTVSIVQDLSSTLNPLDDENIILKSFDTINDNDNNNDSNKDENDDKINIIHEFGTSTELPTNQRMIIPTQNHKIKNIISDEIKRYDEKYVTTTTLATTILTTKHNNKIEINNNNNNNNKEHSSIGRLDTITPTVPVNFPNNALKTAVTTVRTYLGMQNNITNSKLSLPLTRNDNSNGNIGGSRSSSSSSRSSSSSSSSVKLNIPKSHKTDAPMLNYIFDSFSTANKHHHHDQRYGPHFEDIRREGNITNITVQAGSTVQLNCRISLLQDKTVSWVKRNSNGGEEALELLTVGVHTYSGDNRFTMEFQYPSNWRLKIANARKSDEGTYECQISTHPPRVIQINLHVNAPKVMIVDEYGTPLQEKYYEIDSTLQLSCIVRNVVMSSSVVYWSHGDQTLNYDLTRGGVSVKTELMEDGANSTLFIARINKSDSGNYTCSINSSHEYTIMVHILNGESFAELHHGNSSKLNSTTAQIIFLIILLIFTLHRSQISIILR